MHQLVYISTMRRPLDEAELRTILETSVRNNQRGGVTGLLLAGGNRFLQALEGPAPAILSTYERIRKDGRHFACVTLSSATVDQRAFGEWGMAFERSQATRVEGTLPAVVERLTSTLTDLNLQAQLRGFATLHAA